MTNDRSTHPDLAQFPIVVTMDVAWGDMDSYGHVNNVAYFRYFENARIALLDRIGWMGLKLSSGLGPIIHSTHARYRKPLRYPDRIHVGARVAEVQTDRITVAYRLVSEAWNAVACEGEAVVVSYDYVANSKVPLPETIRRGLEALDATRG